MLKLEDLHAGYPDHPVLHGVDLEINPGERLGVLGRNGVGKTTLVRAVVGSIPVRRGSVILDGRTLNDLPDHARVRAGVAHVPQGRGMFPKLSVLENLKTPAAALYGRAWRAHVEPLLDEFPLLADRATRPAGSLSGGQQQTVALARALLTEPKVLLLDEPTEGIQPSVLDEISDVLLQVNERRQVALVLVEQKLDFAARLVDEAVVIDRGRVRRKVSMAELQSSRELQRELLAV